jgi:polyisoprenyl-phosphate glycosyltransferase
MIGVSRDASTLASPIPTDDAAAALQFCRTLAQLLSPDQLPARTRPVLSVVIPVYEEEANLPMLYERLTPVMAETEPNYEIIFVDDGSHDHSVEVMRDLAARDPHISVVELSRNFGHQIAISAGLDYAQGDGVIIMDADLQDPPEVLPQFIAKWRDGHEVVYAIRAQRKEGWFKRGLYALFYRMLQRIANIDIPLDAGDFCIMDRRVVDILNGMPERNRFVRGIRSWVGLDQIGLEYERQSRYAGRVKYSYRRLVYLALDGLISFSFVPLRMITIVGFVISAISILMAISYTIQKVTVGLDPPGFATTIVAIFFLAGIQLITLGVIGEYVGRIFEEVKQRPLYIVRRVTGAER